MPTTPLVSGPPAALPADNHVHSQWSWDATKTGDMEATCARAVQVGLPAIAFTEHVDHTARSKPFDVDGYLATVERCRDRYPTLRILTGVELGEPHWDLDDTEELLTGGRFERVLASLHSVRDLPGHPCMPVLYQDNDSRDVVRNYLGELEKLITNFGGFQVLAHIDYPLREYPGQFDIRDFEEEYRHVLRVLASTGRALEFNTRIPMPSPILRWWRDEGGDAICFASDAHNPASIADGFHEAVAVAEATGFAPGRDPLDFWGRD